MQALNETNDLKRVAFYHPMGSGKTFTGAEKMMQLDAEVNLIICQKSKIQDWIDHFKEYYPQYEVCNLTNKGGFEMFMTDYDGGHWMNGNPAIVGFINYELAFRRPDLLKLSDFTLMLDESSLIQNETAKRSKFILRMHPANVILLSGTPVGGRYERLWSQMQLLGWNIPKKMFYDHYVDYEWDESNGFPMMVIKGYKNEERLKRKMRQYGCNFLTMDDLFDLPKQIHQTIRIDTSKEYRKFRKDSIVTIDGIELVGDTVLTQMLYERQLCGQYNQNKLEAFRDILDSTSDRLIVFYNFNAELKVLSDLVKDTTKAISLVNGSEKDLSAYNQNDDSVTFIQYQAGAMGLNLQKANRIIYFTPPLSSELFEQSKKRIHRIGQDKTCFYYYLTCKGSVEEKIYRTLEMRKDYTEALFEQEEQNAEG